jgi:hypothetical protein
MTGKHGNQLIPVEYGQLMQTTAHNQNKEL